MVSDDVYEVSLKWITLWLSLSHAKSLFSVSFVLQGIRALTIDKDNAPKVSFPPHSASLCSAFGLRIFACMNTVLLNINWRNSEYWRKSTKTLVLWRKGLLECVFNQILTNWLVPLKSSWPLSQYTICNLLITGALISSLYWLQWDPVSLDKVQDKDLDMVFQPYEAHLELQVPESEESRLVFSYFFFLFSSFVFLSFSIFFFSLNLYECSYFYL